MFNEICPYMMAYYNDLPLEERREYRFYTRYLTLDDVTLFLRSWALT
jgi:hypothetical protein